MQHIAIEVASYYLYHKYVRRKPEGDLNPCNTFWVDCSVVPKGLKMKQNAYIHNKCNITTHRFALTA